MNILSFKALSYILLSSTLFFNSAVAVAAPQVTAEVVARQQVIDLNKSTIEDLLTLKGIGHKRAQAILAYRARVGTFNSVEELMKIKGIGEKILMVNKARLKI